MFFRLLLECIDVMRSDALCIMHSFSKFGNENYAQLCSVRDMSLIISIATGPSSDTPFKFGSYYARLKIIDLDNKEHNRWHHLQQTLLILGYI